MRTYEHPAETRAALERRLGAIDDQTWERLTQDWTLYTHYSDADLRDLLPKVSKVGDARRRRRKRFHAMLREAWGDRWTPSLQEDVQQTRENLTFGGTGVYEALFGAKPSGDAFWEPLLASVLMTPVAIRLLDVDRPEEERLQTTAAWLDLVHWWRTFEAQVARLAAMHRISILSAVEHLTGHGWVWGRNRRRAFKVLHDVPERAFLGGWETQTRIVAEKRAWRHSRTECIEVFLKVIDWQPADGPPLGSWDDARRTFNRVVEDVGSGIGYEGTQTQAFRQAVLRAHRRMAR